MKTSSLSLISPRERMTLHLQRTFEFVWIQRRQLLKMITEVHRYPFHVHFAGNHSLVDRQLQELVT